MANIFTSIPVSYCKQLCIAEVYLSDITKRNGREFTLDMDREVMPGFVSSLNLLRSGKSPFLNFHTADGIGSAWNGNSITVPVPALRRRLSSSLLVSKLGATARSDTDLKFCEHVMTHQR